MKSDTETTPGTFLSADDIRAATFVRHVEIHDTLGSTNDRAAELARRTNIELPALVVARHQTAGRGRGKNAWWSAEGALTFSILLEPAAMGIQSANWPQLSLATAVAVCDALEQELKLAAPQTRVGIKWPNDVMLDGRKVAGILIESPGGAAPAKDRLVVGIGINVNNPRRLSPNCVTADGIAICDATGKLHDLQMVLAKFLQHWHTRLGQLVKGEPQLQEAQQRLCTLTGRFVRIAHGTEHTEGECLGTTIEGAIMLQTSAGRICLSSGSVVGASSMGRGTALK